MKLRWPKLFWNEKLGLPECPYLRRWVLDFGAFALRVHRWQGSDDQRAFHDHAWWFLTCVLKGSYVDITPTGADLLKRGSIRFRKAEHRHTVQILQPGTWTFLVTGPVTRRWTFYVGSKRYKRDKYFAEQGHHPCDDSRPAVRMRPDGSRIK